MNKKQTKRTVYVYAHWQEMTNPALMGVLHSELLRGKEIFSFEYTAEWLKSQHAQLLDPQRKNKFWCVFRLFT
jgi:serine/threonine-protein kinase HipA